MSRVLATAALLVLSTACKGTFLSQVEAGYQLSPPTTGIEHGAVVSGHLGGSEVPGTGIGLSARARVMTGSWAVPEIGPHVFFLYEEDDPVAFYVRANPYVGLGGYQGDVRPMFSAVLEPGLMLYPGTDASALTLSLAAEYTIGPSFDPTGEVYSRAWFTVQVGLAIGGVK